MCLSNCKPDGVGKTLAERTSSDLDTGGIGLYRKLNYCVFEMLMGRSYSFGMAGGLGANLTELLQVLHGEIIPEQVQQGILEHTSMTVSV